MGIFPSPTSLLLTFSPPFTICFKKWPNLILLLKYNFILLLFHIFFKSDPSSYYKHPLFFFSHSFSNLIYCNYLFSCVSGEVVVFPTQASEQDGQ